MTDRTIHLATHAGQLFHVTYATGSENMVLEHLVQLVHDQRIAFDWFDAGMMSYQIGQHLGRELRELREKRANNGVRHG